MQQLETLLAQLIDKKKRLDTLREQSPELAEALSLSDEYHALMAELGAMCSEQEPTIVPYPVYPTWQRYDVTCAPSTFNPPGFTYSGTLQIVK